MRVPARKPLLVLALALATGGSLVLGTMLPGTPAQAQMAVFDPRNYAQNILFDAAELRLGLKKQQVVRISRSARPGKGRRK